jgi:putative phosphoesterase
MSKKNHNAGTSHDLKGEWFKIGEDFYQQTWEQKFGGKNRHFNGGTQPFKVFEKNGKRISADAYKEAKSIHDSMEQAEKSAAAAAAEQPANQPGGQPQPQPALQPAQPAPQPVQQQINVNIQKPAGEPLTEQDKQIAQKIANQAASQAQAQQILVGVISDTHGQIAQVAIDEMRRRGVRHIIHAGDIGSAEVLQQLVQLAPVTAVLGENDTSNYGYPLGQVGRIILGNMRIFITHNADTIYSELRTQSNTPNGTLPQVCIFGRTHVPQVEPHEGILMVNPGSATQPVEGKRPGIMFLQITNGQVSEINGFEWDASTAG